MPRHEAVHERGQRGQWLAARSYIRSLLSHKQASDIGNKFVRYAPNYVQRACERKFDFPIPKVIRESDILLIRIPKTASVSLALQIYGQISYIPHRTASFYRDADRMFFNGSISFAVMRDPVDRAFSAYNWLHSQGSKYAAPDIHGQNLVAGVKSFEDFVFKVLKPASVEGRLQHLDPVLHRQSDYVCDVEGNVIVDNIFELKNMHQIQNFLKKNGVERGEQRENYIDKNILDRNVSNDTAQAVYDVYNEDIKILKSIKS